MTTVLYTAVIVYVIVVIVHVMMIVIDSNDNDAYEYVFSVTVDAMKPKANIFKLTKGAWIALGWPLRLSIKSLVWLTQVEE